MSSTKDKDEALKMDVRAIERELKKGRMTRKEHEKLGKSLPDVKDKSVSLEDVSPLDLPEPVGQA
jgi:hypothetical protein